MKKTVFMLVLIAICTGQAYAETLYITDRFEITLRAGAGTNYRILRMLPSGQQVELIERGGEWTRVKLPGGPEGWVSNQYLQRNPAARDSLRELTARLEPLAVENESLKAENERLLIMNQEIARQLEETKKQFEEAVSNYEQLKEASAEFLTIKEEHDALSTRLEEKRNRIEDLESRMTEEFLSAAIKWFLAGAGVLLAGILLGTRSKKKRPGLR